MHGMGGGAVRIGKESQFLLRCLRHNLKIESWSLILKIICSQMVTLKFQKSWREVSKAVNQVTLPILSCLITKTVSSP